jgi:hypothetical protein
MATIFKKKEPIWHYSCFLFIEQSGIEKSGKRTRFEMGTISFLEKFLFSLGFMASFLVKPILALKRKLEKENA